MPKIWLQNVLSRWSGNRAFNHISPSLAFIRRLTQTLFTEQTTSTNWEVEILFTTQKHNVGSWEIWFDWAYTWTAEKRMTLYSVSSVPVDVVMCYCSLTLCFSETLLRSRLPHQTAPLTTSFLTRASLSVTISLSSAIMRRSSGRLSLFLNFSSVPSNLDTHTHTHDI